MKSAKENEENAKRLSESQAKEVSANDESSTYDNDAPKIKACENKGWDEACEWTYKGVTYHGRCKYNPYALTPTLYCSDVLKVGDDKK